MSLAAARVRDVMATMDLGLTKQDLEFGRKLPGLQKFLDFVARWDLKGIRTVNKTGSTIEVRLGHGKERRSFRVDVHYMSNTFRSGTFSSGWEMARKFFGAFREEMGEICREHQTLGITQPPYRSNGEEVVFAVLCERDPRVKKWYDSVCEIVDGGDPGNRQRKHNRELAMKSARSHLRTAMANGATREEMVEMIDLILVEEIMQR